MKQLNSNLGDLTGKSQFSTMETPIFVRVCVLFVFPLINVLFFRFGSIIMSSDSFVQPDIYLNISLFSSHLANTISINC